MAQATSGAGGVGVGVDEATALGRNVFGVRRVSFQVSLIRADRRRLGKRLRSELDAVRDLLRKAELYSGVPVTAGKDDRLSAPGAAVEDDDDDGCRPAKSRKVCPFAERARESKPDDGDDDRERLAGRLASMAAALPDHAVSFLQSRRRAGDAADSRGDDGEIEMGDDDVVSMKDGALFQLKRLLDKFAPEGTPPKLPPVDMSALAPEVSTPSLKCLGGRAPLAASGVSCLSSQAPHQDAGGRMSPVQEEEEEEEGANICSGVSRIAIRDIAEEYGELVDGVGVQLLSPLQRKYVDLSEEDRYVDICGDASPVVFSASKAGDSSSATLSSCGDSEATSTDSDSSSSSPETVLPKENSYCSAGGEPVPAPEDDPIQGVHNVVIHIAEPETNQCAAAAAAAFAVTKSPPAPSTTVLPEECGAIAQPPEHAPEAVQIAEPPEELNGKRVAPGVTAEHPVTGSAPPPEVLGNESGTSSQPAPVPAPAPAPVAAHIAEPQPQGGETSDLIAMALQERKRRAMARARQVLVEMERAVPPDERIHPRDMELLGISAFEHVVSTVRQRDARTPAVTQVNDGVHGLSLSPGGPSILQQLGVFLKADSGREDDEEEQRPTLAVASDGEEMDMEIEEGQIL